MIRRIRSLSLALAWAVVTGVASAETPAPDDQLVAVVDQRVEDWWLKPDERRFDQIGWADGIRAAKQLSAEHNRPLFLFTMDGRVNTGRC